MKAGVKGFTLMELITVLILVGIISAFVVIRMPDTATYNLSAITEQLRRDIRYTQILALSLNTNYTLVTSSSGYSISPTPPEGAVNVPMPTGVTLSAASVTFNSMGDPALASPVNITITASGVTNTLTVSPETGFVNG